MQEYLEFPEGTSEAQMNLVHKHLDCRDWETFIETTTSEQFLEKSEQFKNLRGRITDNHRLGPEGYAGKEKGKWRKEHATMEEAGTENPWR
ncbi:hypothetical protein C2845_PM13G10630 [Panicum miliaceum]|uniref:Uncharacterized protein n=1 Tax=Panicum miliaceum TaxID=4540 RepID=A0A3L6RJY8_PANMI|nr:hypothetical protein C2845_PM13G10630 [Panicum miliaceum]